MPDNYHPHESAELVHDELRGSYLRRMPKPGVSLRMEIALRALGAVNWEEDEEPEVMAGYCFAIADAFLRKEEPGADEEEK